MSMEHINSKSLTTEHALWIQQVLQKENKDYKMFQVLLYNPVFNSNLIYNKLDYCLK